MPSFHFFMKVRVDINKYGSGQALMDRWLQEAEGAGAAEEAGAVVTLWKDNNEPVVLGVIKLDADNALQAHAAFLEAIKGLPMGQDNALVLEEVRGVSPYGEWRELLRRRPRS